MFRLLKEVELLQQNCQFTIGEDYHGSSSFVNGRWRPSVNQAHSRDSHNPIFILA